MLKKLLCMTTVVVKVSVCDEISDLMQLCIGKFYEVLHVKIC